MKILFKAVGYNFQDELKDHFGTILNSQFKDLEYVQRGSIKITSENTNKKVKLELTLRNGAKIFASSIKPTEIKAFKESLQKVKTQVQSYKDINFQRNH